MKGLSFMKTIIIGAGAAGLTAAIYAARNKSEVIIIEHQKQAGKKILITGNGRCNLSNECLEPSMYYGDLDFVGCILKHFNVSDALEFFRSIGLYTCSKNGYIYPMSLQANSVLNFLRDEAIGLGVKIKTNNTVSNIRQENNKFFVNIGIELECDNLILATGGYSFPKTGADGTGYKLAKKFHHTIINPKPALTALICNDDILKKASGVRIHSKVTINQVEQMGELQITDYGISGIPVFNISRLINPGDVVTIDFAPETDEDSLFHLISHLSLQNPKRSIDFALNGLFHEKMVSVFMNYLDIHNELCSSINEKDIRNFVKQIKNYTVHVQKRRGFEFAQVTAGGVSTDEINPLTMESKKVKNLYFAGEIIDVDGICGGYNLHFAWASGAIAGGSCK